MIKKTYLRNFALTVLSLGMMVGVAVADPIEGTINFTGQWDAVDDTYTGVGIDVATGVAFIDPYISLSPGPTGDFSLLQTGALGVVAFTDFQFSPFDVNMGTLWTTGDFTFTLTSLSGGWDNDVTIGLNGSGIMTSTIGGLEPTPFVWEFSGQGGSTTLSFSAGNSAVPEPATMLLFGTGLVGLAGVSRSRKKAQK